MFEARLILLPQGGVVPPQFQRAQQQLGKIDHPGAGTGLLVGAVDAQHGGQEQVTGGLDVLGPDTLVLLPVDPPLGLTRRPLVLVQPQLADHPLDQSQLVVTVEDLELLGQPGLAPVSPQQAVGQPVEGADPHAIGGNAQQLFDALAHLGGGLVGEGDRQDAPG